jgi:ATP-binding cassette, subfamily B, bacterial
LTSERPRAGAAIAAPARPGAVVGDGRVPSPTLFVLRLLGAAVWQHRQRTLGAFVLVLLAKAAAVLVPLSLKGIVDQLSQVPAPAALSVALVVGYAILRFLGSFFSELRDVLFARVTQLTVSGFLLRVFAHLHRLGTRFHARSRMGGLARDVERGSAGVGFLLGIGLFTIVPTLVEIVAVMAIMSAHYSQVFTLIILATFIAYASFTIVFTERRAIFQRALNELDSSANGTLVDSLVNQETVKHYSNEGFEVRRFGRILDQWVEVGVQNQKALSLLHIGQSALIAIGVASVMLIAARYVFAGTMSVGDLILVNAYIIQICLPLNSLGFVFRQARDAVVNAERMLRLLDQKPEIEDSPVAPDVTLNRGEVKFEHVNFGYDASRQVLWDVSFTIPAGGTVAVVGGSGSGKSTLARLLFRFYDTASGHITIDDIDIRAMPLASLRAALGIVPQDTLLFNESIAYNIGYGRPGATFDDIVEAARAAHVHDFIAGLPEGYDTLVGERGVKLSGGERQRIAIARAMLKNPPIMVFDEATSALDTRAERSIQEELDRLAKTRTTLIIAHRLSTVVDADEILVLEHGRIVERGTHEHLLSLQGLYAQLWSLQRQQQQVESTERDLALQPINLTALLAGVVDGLRAEIDASQAGFFSTITADALRVTGNPGRLQQVMWSLAAHAVASSPRGGRIEWRIERIGERARVSFTHAGMPLPRTGAAAGLLDAHRVAAILEQHGGHYDTADAAPGLIDEYVELPLRSAADIPRILDAPAAPRQPAPLPAISGARVLVIDDSSDGRQQIESVLRAQGVLTLGHASGAAALEELARLPRDRWPDLLICDIALGEEDGHEVLRQLRRFEAEQGFTLEQRLPAIALSGYDTADYRMRALLAGFQMQLRKPASTEQLVGAVASLLAYTAKASDRAWLGDLAAHADDAGDTFVKGDIDDASAR